MTHRAVACGAIAIALSSIWPLADAQAGVLRYCDRPLQVSADQQDKLFRFAGLLKDQMAAGGLEAVLVSRSGTDLSRFGQRYSHAGVALKDSANGPWSIRQLYFACDEGRPRLFDQGASGFVLGTDDARIGYVSMLFLPPDPARTLAQTALDNERALELLNPDYSANAYAFSLRYQNCNQWIAELLAQAWGGAPGQPASRAQSQDWLRRAGFTPTVFDVGPALMAVGAFIPWVHDDDHPREDLERKVYRVSMPASIEAFVRGQVPGTTRVEMCHTERHVVVRRGWMPLPEGCVPEAGDTVVALD